MKTLLSISLVYFYALLFFSLLFYLPPNIQEHGSFVYDIQRQVYVRTIVHVFMHLSLFHYFRHTRVQMIETVFVNSWNVICSTLRSNTGPTLDALLIVVFCCELSRVVRRFVQCVVACFYIWFLYYYYLLCILCTPLVRSLSLTDSQRLLGCIFYLLHHHCTPNSAARGICSQYDSNCVEVHIYIAPRCNSVLIQVAHGAYLISNSSLVSQTLCLQPLTDLFSQLNVSSLVFSSSSVHKLRF